MRFSYATALAHEIVAQESRMQKQRGCYMLNVWKLDARTAAYSCAMKPVGIPLKVGFQWLAVLGLLLGSCAAPDEWTAEFAVDRDNLASTGRNPYFILEPGYTLVLEGGNERLVITVLEETLIVDGVETRVVEERETKGGNLVEVSRNYYAIDTRTKDVYYFGEDVDMFTGGQISAHRGAWLSGVGDARFGLMMPGRVVLEAKHYQEIAPGIAMDRARIVGLSETLMTPAGQYADALKVEETSPLEPLVVEYKYYAPGIGMIRDGPLELVEYGAASN